MEILRAVAGLSPAIGLFAYVPAADLQWLIECWRKANACHFFSLFAGMIDVCTLIRDANSSAGADLSLSARRTERVRLIASIVHWSILSS